MRVPGGTVDLEPETVETAAREGMQRRGAIALGAGLVAGGLGGVALWRADGRSSYQVAGLAACGAGGVLAGLGILWLVRGRAPDLTAPPAFAVGVADAGAMLSVNRSF